FIFLFFLKCFKQTSKFDDSLKLSGNIWSFDVDSASFYAPPPAPPAHNLLETTSPPPAPQLITTLSCFRPATHS
ncbi:MAG: hypothetical protein AAGJ35_04965, partial [Myxococcota bacterium]